MYRLFLLLLLFAAIAGVASAQQPIVGQPCGAAGVSSISTTGQAVQCQGSPLLWVATGGSGGGGGPVTCNNLPTFTGDVTTPGASCVTTAVKLNGGNIPLSTPIIGTNGQGQAVASVGHGIASILSCPATSGSGTAYVCSTSPTFTPQAQDAILFKSDVANTGAATLNVNATSAASITKQGGSVALAANDLLVGQNTLLIFDGTNWQMQGHIGNAPLTSTGATNQDTYFSSPTNLAGVGPGLTGQVKTANNNAPPSFNSPGVAGTDVNAASYTIKCDSATALVDRATTIRFITTTPTVTIPDPTASGCGSNFPVTLIASGVTVTVNRTTTAVFNIYNGSTVVTGATSFTLPSGQFATLTSPDNANWLVRLVVGFNATAHAVSAVLDCSAASGSGTAYTCTTSPSFAPADGDAILFEADVANTGAATLNVNSSTAAPVQKQHGSALVANDLKAGADVLLIFDGTNWQLQIADAAATFSTSVGTGTPPAIVAGTGGLFACTEGTNATALATADILNCNSANHDLELSNNGGTFFHVTQTIASGTAAMTTAAITAGNCGTTVTVSATNVLTTDTITWAFNAAPAGSNAGIVAWPTANNVNFAYCSNTAQTPAAATINWRVVR